MEKFNFIPVYVVDSKDNQLGIEGFIRSGTIEDCKALLKEKQKGSQGTIKIMRLEEVIVT